MRCLLDRLPAVAATAILLTPALAVAQPSGKPEPIPVDGGGTEFFRLLLDYRGIKPITERELSSVQQHQWGDIILISLGNPFGGGNRHLAPLNHLGPASERGGVLIATDTGLSELLSVTGAQLMSSGERVVCRDNLAIHRDEETCPYLVPVPSVNPKATLQLFNGLSRIATNSPSYLKITGWGGDFQHPLARFPRNCRFGFQERALPENALFAIGGEGPDDWNSNAYRLLVMADHSIFINQMLLEPGTHNLELTYRVIDYLQGPHKRKRCVFFEDGRLVDHFDDLRRAYAKQNQMPLPQVNLWGMQDKLTDFGNAIVDRLQTNNAHNNLLLGSGDQQRSLSIIARFLLILAAAIACLFLLRRAWGARKPGDLPPPPTVAGVPTGPPGVFDRRQKELLRRNNVYEPVRDLVREFFASIGVHDDGKNRPPKLVISDVVRKPDSLRTAIKDFWKVAFGPPQVMTVNRWRELEPFLERLRQAHADGKWRFVVAESSAGSVA
jgi:hypothetical protein